MTQTHKPIIGITPLVDDEKHSIWMLPGYMDGIMAAGGLPIILPLTDLAEDANALAGMIDGLLLAGGHDVDPARYGAARSALCGHPHTGRDTLEYLLLDVMLRTDKPVFGICRGIQLLNVYLGGTLYQDIPAEMGTRVAHAQKPPYDIPSHTVAVAAHTPLYDIVHKAALSVNSYHHQGVRALANGLVPMAHADDGLVEAVYMPDRRYVLAIQWHPEFSYRKHEDQLQLFRAFVDACRE
jgi:putative glutamine amidotransferase